MGNLLLILLCLFAALALVVKLTEKNGKPLSPEQQAKYSKITMVLVFILLVAGLFRHLLG